MISSKELLRINTAQLSINFKVEFSEHFQLILKLILNFKKNQLVYIFSFQ